MWPISGQSSRRRCLQPSLSNLFDKANTMKEAKKPSVVGRWRTILIRKNKFLALFSVMKLIGKFPGLENIMVSWAVGRY